ncbi:PelD GGDEF domain-containing protein [Pandoraea nosoerga]|uniref:Transmembrane protein n=1 Tax=Pandoraea nosoerga TaxID=2508296 RepID=A0A5E4Y0G4_9BURK|nr:PelD GGDEF domain-containing protein [Pandoraea nosoerga]VVE41768.1 transmembrane protein [Pandoraea nosoerga]
MTTATPEDAEPARDAPSSVRVRRSQPLGNLGRWGRWVAPAMVRPFALLEVVVGTVLALLVAWRLRPDDPLLLATQFPWLWLVVLVFALRYGALAGVASSLVLVAGWYGLSARPGMPFPTVHFAGGTIVALVAGHFCDIWSNRAHRAQGINAYYSDRLVAITHNHYLLRVSHERLERDLLARPVTLRDALTRLRDLSSRRAGDIHTLGSGLPNAQPMLEFAALTCQIEVASLFPVRAGRLVPTAIARVGEGFEPNPDDPLVQHCLSEGTLAHVRADDAASDTRACLACAPLLDGDGTLVSLLIVRRMPFLALNHDNLQLLLVLLAYYADGVAHQPLVAAVRESVPQAPYDFALELGRLARLKRASGIESSLVALAFPRGARGDSLFEQTVRQRRALDALWTIGTPRRQIAIALMPITDEHGIDGYLMRVETLLRQQYDVDFETGHIAVHTAHVDPESPGEGLLKLMERCVDHG